jgi:cell division septum initiation protein DivIVA
MPDDIEILLQEVAILRQEIAQIRAMVEKSDESLRSFNTALLQLLDALMVSMRAIEARLPPLN